MTITLDREELNTFVSKLRNWNVGLVDHVLTNARMTPDGIVGNYAELKAQYIRNNPEPDWRTLL